SPFDLLAWLCALVPPPRFHMLRYHGVLAAHAKARPEGVPTAECGDDSPQLLLPSICARDQDEARGKGGRPKSTRLKWASLLARVFRVDVTVCPACRGPMSIRRFVTDPTEAKRLIAQ